MLGRELSIPMIQSAHFGSGFYHVLGYFGKGIFKCTRVVVDQSFLVFLLAPSN